MYDAGYHRVVHCAEGRCKHEIYRMPQCFVCRTFLNLVKSGKNPTNCFWYDHTRDQENFKNKKKRKDANMSPITFICSYPTDTIRCDNRKEGLNLIRKGLLKKYKTVVVRTTTESFNLDSPRGKEYFGVKGR